MTSFLRGPCWIKQGLTALEKGKGNNDALKHPCGERPRGVTAAAAKKSNSMKRAGQRCHCRKYAQGHAS